MNHHAASSTEWPTVRSPWLRRMAALLSPRAWAIRLPSSTSSDHAGVVVEDGVVLVEGAHVLGDRVEGAPERTTTTCRRRSGRGRRPRRRVAPRGPGEWMAKAAALTGRSPSTTSPWWLTRIRSETRDVAEVHAERIHPEVVEPLGVPGGDVAGHPLVEPELREQAERGGQALLAVEALVGGIVERHPGRQLHGFGHGVLLVLAGSCRRPRSRRCRSYARTRSGTPVAGPSASTTPAWSSGRLMVRSLRQRVRPPVPRGVRALRLGAPPGTGPPRPSGPGWPGPPPSAHGRRPTSRHDATGHRGPGN